VCRRTPVTIDAVCNCLSLVSIRHYKRSQEEMRDQVRGTAEYSRLDDGENGSASPMDFAREAPRRRSSS
jgi:hypothetical protein